MGLRVTSDTATIPAPGSLAQTGRLHATCRLATGLRLSAAVETAATAVAERLRAQIRSTNQANRPAQHGVWLAQRGEAALAEVSHMLLRMRELANQTNSSTAS